MAKIGLSQVTTAQTFQTWLDRTNELVDIISTDALTASVLGDTTTGNATLVGSFTANTIVAVDTLRTDLLSPKDGSTSISVSSPVTINSTSQTTQTLISSSGPRALYSSGSLIWSAGFENTTSNRFIINTGAGAVKLALSPTGDLSVAGSISATGSVTATAGFVGNITGNIYASDGTTRILDNGNGTTTSASFIGNVTGDVIGNVTGNVTGDIYASNGTTKILENGNGTTVGASFTGNAATVTNGVYTNSASIFTAGNKKFNDNVSANFGTGNDARLYYNGSNVILTVAAGNILISDNSTTRFQFNPATGDFIANGNITAFGSASDVSLKENLVKIGGALEKVNSINGYTFNYIGNKEKMTGVIAQEIEAVLPEVVYETTDDKGKTSKAVRYGNVVGLLIEAIKELKAEIEELKNNGS